MKSNRKDKQLFLKYPIKFVRQFFKYFYQRVFFFRHVVLNEATLFSELVFLSAVT